MTNRVTYAMVNSSGVIDADNAQQHETITAGDELEESSNNNNNNNNTTGGSSSLSAASGSSNEEQASLFS
jgi:hypothetical protein